MTGIGVTPIDRLRVDGWGVATTAGPGKRNQDRVGADGTLFTVADGLGGLAAGHLAATAAVTALHAAQPRDAADLAQALFGANNAVRTVERDRSASIGTTLAVALVASSALVIASIGDSRVYRVEATDRFELLTVDDNEAGRQGVGYGTEGYADMARHLHRYLGADAILDVRPRTLHDLGSEVRLVLTTDGVHDALDPTALDEVTRRDDPGQVASALVVAARLAATHDDASAVVVDITVREGA